MRVRGENYSDLWSLSLAGLNSNPGQNNWTELDATEKNGGGSLPGGFYWGYPPMMVYDPVGDTAYLWNTYGGLNWSYKPSTNTFKQLTVGANNVVLPDTATPVLYPPTQTIYWFGGSNNAGTQAASTGGPTVYSVSYASGATWIPTNITSLVNSNCNPLSSAMAPGVAYDSATGKIVGWPNFGNTVYIFDPTTKACTAQTFSGGPPDSTNNTGQYTTGTYGRFQYFPALDEFALVNAASTDAFILKLSGTSSCTITTLSLPSTLSGAAYNQMVGTSGCASPSFSISSGALPSGVTLNAGTGAITGAAATVGTYSFTVGVTAGSTNTSQPLSITVTSASVPSITSFTATPNSVTPGQASALSWVAGGATSLSISPGSFTSASASGLTSVSPAATTVYTLTATNSAGSATAQATVTVAATPPPPTISNTFTITNSGATVTNYPVQIGRPFVQGQIPSGQFPQAFLASAALPTQVDVKNFWPDNSLRYAVVSFLIPTFTAGQSYTITLSSGSTVGNTALTQAQMLAASYNFDAQIQLTNTGTTKTASARTMLANGDYTVWASGPIATTIILANHAQTATCGGNAASTYDFGFDSYCAFRPEFEATFWPTTNQVFVRYIGEIANTQQMEDVVVNNLVLTIGNTSPSTVYTIPSGLTPLTMGALTRWTKTFWLNGTPPSAGYNHNLAYLAATKMVPNYDTSQVIPASQIASAYATWSGLSTADPYDAADFTKAQAAVGGRNYPADEIGPYTGPEVMWLYSGDYRAQQMAIRYAELAGAWPIHWREGNSAKYIDRAHTISSLGHWMSISSRPTYCTQCGGVAPPGSYFTYSGIAAGDKVTRVGATANSTWIPDVAHEPDFTPVYLLTGDYYFLEESWAWATATELAVDGSRNDYPGRGPTGAGFSYGHLPGNSVWGLQVRGSAWGLRNVVEAESLSPDSSPEQGYYDLLVKDTLAAWEGERNITTGAYHSNTMWTWGNQFAAANYCTTHGGIGLWCANAIAGVQNGPPTVIPFWVPDGGVSNNLCNYPVQSGIQPNVGCTSPWMVQYMIYALGRAKDLGYPSQALLSWVAPWIISQVTDPTFNPYLVSMYRQPTVQANGQYFTTWASILATVCNSVGTGCVSGAGGTNAQTVTTWAAPTNEFNCALSTTGDGNCSSALEAGMAIAQVADQPNGAAAWNWIYTNAMSLSSINGDPKWDIIPRSSSSLEY